MQMAKDTGDFRSRLRGIPNLDERPIDDRWLGRTGPLAGKPETPTLPVPGEPVPVARPGLQLTTADPLHEPYTPTDDPDAEFETTAPRRRRWPLVLLALALLAVLVVAVPLMMAWRTFESIETVDLGTSLTDASTVSGVNVLLVGTDSREGISADSENANVILDPKLGALERSDTIMILRLADDGSTAFMSLPRDLWLPIAGGGQQRINTAIGRGPEAVVHTIQDELEIPITNYVQIDLAGFIELVDAIGGVPITIPYPAFDRASGLDLLVAGEVMLDSAQALAYVRSRHYTEIVDGQQRTDPTSDLGRVQRQQDFLRAMFAELADERNPLTLNTLLGSMGEAVVLDESTSFIDVLGMARRLRAGTPETVTLPTRPERIGGNAVLLLAPGAEEQLARFRG